MYNATTWKEKIFAGKINDWLELYFHDEGIHHYAISSILYLAMIQKNM